MSDEKKLSVGQYNLIIDNFLNGTPLPKESKPYEDHCPHISEDTYQGLFRIEYICRSCGNKRSENPMPSSGWPDHDDNGSI